MVLEKDSSVLGYPGEVSKALNADHHGVCKYDSMVDPNYVTVRNVLKSLISKVVANRALQTSDDDKATVMTRRRSVDLRATLAISELPSVDYAFFRDQWVEGTGGWILQHETYLEWLRCDEPSPRLLWLTGGAASGKSVLTSVVINSLVGDQAEGHCQYYFIRFGDRKKRTLSLLLRSLTYQMALNIPGFQEKVIELADEAIGFETADPRIVWECIKSALVHVKTETSIFWIIDGLDEAENPRAVLKYLADLSSVTLPIRILVVSRKTTELDTAFQRLPPALHKTSIDVEGHAEDLRSYMLRELELDIPGDSEFTQQLMERVIRGAQNNFLVRLARLQNSDPNHCVGALNLIY